MSATTQQPENAIATDEMMESSQEAFSTFAGFADKALGFVTMGVSDNFEILHNDPNHKANKEQEQKENMEKLVKVAGTVVKVAAVAGGV